jgi:hypothetical protein
MAKIVLSAAMITAGYGGFGLEFAPVHALFQAFTVSAHAGLGTFAYPYRRRVTL